MGLFNRIIDKMVSDKVPFKKRKRLIVFVAIITLLSMTTATVAWFTVNTVWKTTAKTLINMAK